MAVAFEPHPHPRIAARKEVGPPRTADQHTGINGRIALGLTTAVGTMWCAYAFAVLALLALPEALATASMLPIIQWLSQTFIQLVMLSVIMVGQRVQSEASDKRAEMTYLDADAVLHETQEIQGHLLAQDAAIQELLEQVATLRRATTDG